MACKMACLSQTQSKSRLGGDKVDHHQLHDLGNVGNATLYVELAQNIYVIVSFRAYSFPLHRNSPVKEPSASRKHSVCSRSLHEHHRFAGPVPYCSRHRSFRVSEAEAEG